MQSQTEKRQLTTNFFQLLEQRNLTQAEVVLEKMRQEVKKTEWQRGYVRALRGMLVASRSGDDKRAFINRMKDRDLGEIKKDFTRKSREPLQTSFDRGFFTAWVEYLEFSEKAEPTWRKPEEAPMDDSG